MSGRAPVGRGVELAYDEVGTGEPLVLVMGIGCQMVLWDERFCALLAKRGFRVIRFDNRDIGLSTWFDDHGVPNVQAMLPRVLAGLPVTAPYTLSDMAADVAGLLDHLGLDAAHVVGASMGGMIAQHLAFEAPARVRTLTSIMSSPGSRRAWLSSNPSALAKVLRPRPVTRETALPHTVDLYRVLHGPALPFPEAEMRALLGRAIERAWHPAGFPRQMAAILASGNRTRRLAAVRAPTLVLHGEVDPLIGVAAGRATAKAIPGARFSLVPKMGHTLPPEAWPALVDAIAGHAR
ncbi:MAG: alpha/beta fold hydrolase [Myxococcota bacterium]